MALLAPPRAPERRPLPAGFGTIWTTVALDLIGFGIVLPILADLRRALRRQPDHARASSCRRSRSPSSSSRRCWGGCPTGSAASRSSCCRCSAPPSAACSPAGPRRCGCCSSGASSTARRGRACRWRRARSPTWPRPRSGPACSACSARRSASASCSARPSAGWRRWPGPRVPFFVAAGIAFVNGLVAIKRLPETHPPEARRRAVAESRSRWSRRPSGGGPSPDWPWWRSSPPPPSAPSRRRSRCSASAGSA